MHAGEQNFSSTCGYFVTQTNTGNWHWTAYCGLLAKSGFRKTQLEAESAAGLAAEALAEEWDAERWVTCGGEGGKGGAA